MFDRLIQGIKDFPAHFFGTLIRKKRFQGLILIVVGMVLDRYHVSLPPDVLQAVLGLFLDAADAGFDVDHLPMSLPMVAKAIGVVWAAYGGARASGPVPIVPPKPTPPAANDRAPPATP